MRELENGFSVSETSDSAVDDIHSSGPSSHLSTRHSPDYPIISRGGLPPRSVGGFGGDLNPGQIDLEARVRLEQQKASMMGDVAAAKHKYIKRVGTLEKQLDQARNEKRELQHLIES